MAETYSAGIVTAYGAAVRGGYTGTYEQFCAEQAQFGANAAKVAQDRAAVEAATQTFTTVTVPGAVQTVQQTGATQVQAVEAASETEQQQIALAGAAQETRVTQAGDDQVDAVEEAGATQVGNVNTAGTTQVGNVNTAGTTQVGAVNTAGATQVQAVEDKGQEVIDSIPDDYTELTEDVADLESAINQVITITSFNPNFDSFSSVASLAIRASGETNGDFVGTLESITVKVRANSEATERCYLLSKSGSIYTVYAQFNISIPQTNDSTVTLVNGTAFEYDGEVSKNTYVAISESSINLFYYSDGTNGLSLGTDPIANGATFNAVSVQTGYNISIGFTVKRSKIDDIEAEIDAIEENIDTVEDDIDTIKGQLGTSDVSYVPNMTLMTSSTSIAGTRLSGNLICKNGTLKKIVVAAKADGTLNVVLAKAIVGGVKIIAVIPLSVTEGTHEYTNGVDFTYSDPIEMNTYIGATTSSINIGYGTDNVSSVNAPLLANAIVGDEITGVNLDRQTYNVGIGAIITPTKVQRSGRIFETVQYTDDYRYYDDNDEVSCNVKLTGLTGTLKLMKSGTPGLANGGGIFVDFANNKCGFYKRISSASDTPVVYSEVTVDTITFASGGKYSVAWTQEVNGTTITIIDLVSFDTFTTTHASNTLIGRGGGTAFKVDGTDMTVTNFRHFSLQNGTPKTLILGDSWVEATTLNGNREDRWCYLYKEEINGNAFIFAMGGAATSSGLLWLEAIKDIVNPSYVILAFGINQANLLVYKYEITQLIDIVKNDMNAIPVLVKIPPTKGASGTTGIVSDINSFVESSGEMYIDMATPLTVDGDETTRNNNLFLGDETHPTIAGHLAIFNEMKATAPELFCSY